MPQPPYISKLGVGELSVTPPGVFTGCRAMIFSAKGNRRAMQSFAETYLQAPTDGAVSVTVPTSTFFLYFFNAERLSSPASPIGWTPNHEFSIAIPIILRLRGHLLPRLAMWAPYVVIDNARGMVTGRESWGWFKGHGEIASPRDPHREGPDCRVSTLIFPKFAPDTEGRVAPLVQVRSRSEETPPTFEAVSHDAGPAAALGKSLVHLATQEEDLEEEFMELAGELMGKLMPAVNLKQFRDTSDPALACHQSLSTCPIDPLAVRSVDLIRGDLDIEFTPCDSHQLISQLGLPGPIIPAGLSLTADLDYQASNGETLWTGS